MNWLLLIVGGLFEAGFTFCLGQMKSTSGLIWAGWLFGFLLSTVISMGLLLVASKTLPIGTAYPVWTGVGAVGSVLIGLFFFHEPATFWRLFFIFMLIVSIVGLKVVS